MAKVALVETKPSRTNFNDAFENAFEFDRYQLCSNPAIKKALKKDVDIDINVDDYDWIILVGADSFKYFTGKTSISDFSGKPVNEKYIPIINPAMLTFKPEAERLWQESKTALIRYITGKAKVVSYNSDKIYGITEEQQALEYIQAAILAPSKYVALDSEASALYARDGHVLGISLCYERDHGVYISADCITPEVEEKLQELFNKKIVIFHNAKFDIGFFWYHFGWEFPRFEDTMLLHYCIEENPGNHGLKQLALKYTVYGDYEAGLEEFKTEYCKKNGVKKDDFTYDLIPFDIMFPYAAIDSIVTFLLFLKLKAAVTKNPKLHWVYENILIPGSDLLTEIQDNGVPFDRNRLEKASIMMQTDIDNAIAELYEHPVIREFEEAQGKTFNPGSTQQLRKLLFDYVGLTPTGKKTGTGAASTDAEVLEELSEYSEIPKLILNIRKKSKIKNTYLDKIIPQLDADGRLRTGFNLHSTTSGRLSSSGKLNMQQLPRDNPAVKGCIRARPGYKIVSMDLTTAEVYVAAVLSGDKKLQGVFKSGQDFHSTIAKMVFKLDCEVKDVKRLYPHLRQGAKSTTFGILYQAGAITVANQIRKESGIYCSVSQAQKYIDDYFKEFKQLHKWIEAQKDFIATNGFIYSHFGRKRRLPNVKSSDKGIKAHTIRSGVNFLVQSPASDINLFAAIEMRHFINKNKMKALMFALVHDSILAEVPEDEIDLYTETLRGFVQADRGLSIPGYPIGCDFEVGDDYSFNAKHDDYPDETKYQVYERGWDSKLPQLMDSLVKLCKTK